MLKNLYVNLAIILSVLLMPRLFADTYTESFEQIRTLGVGFQESIDEMPSTQQLANCNLNDNHDNLTNAGLKAGSKYVRMLWQDFEPSDNTFQFDKLDDILKCAHDEGKSVDLRVMLSWPDKGQGLPDWLVNKGINVDYINNGSTGGGSGLATIQSINVPVSESSKGNIIDADDETSWANNGSQSTAHFDVNLDSSYSITKIRYKDINDREMIFKIDGNVVFEDWLSNADSYTEGGYAEIILSTPVTGSQVTVETLDTWIVAKDIEIYY